MIPWIIRRHTAPGIKIKHSYGHCTLFPVRRQEEGKRKAGTCLRVSAPVIYSVRPAALTLLPGRSRRYFGHQNLQSPPQIPTADHPPPALLPPQ